MKVWVWNYGKWNYRNYDQKTYDSDNGFTKYGKRSGDSNTGTIDAPFKTIAKARDVVRTVNGNMKSDIYVYLRGGTYNITETITFGPQDSGTNGYRIYYMAYPGNKGYRLDEA